MSDDTKILLVPVEGTKYVTRTVIEKRAPTDESVRLLREMETKAKEEVLRTIAVANTPVECVVHQFSDMLSDRMCWRAIFRINDHVLKAEVWTLGMGGPGDVIEGQDLFRKLRDEMAKVIATELLNGPFVETMTRLWKRA